MDPSGFDLTARLLADRGLAYDLASLAEATTLPALDPPFPWHGRPGFDPAFFGIPPQPPADQSEN